MIIFNLLNFDLASVIREIPSVLTTIVNLTQNQLYTLVEFLGIIVIFLILCVGIWYVMIKKK